ncbi:FAD-dependent oxidoreductase [uncultured Pseudomonas sp.]|uniref:GcvT family protein n=1 Tax=uncultured Pseudomonas sp. TaxID=114707 RepID=UPI00259128EB|nr:FAD-dependent oxidoreductase [uncultured Pseudomonas sp.]
MKSETKVLVIGGGITGVSTLYHLAKAGWTDVMLVEKLELTSGSTWHAAGNLPSFSTSLNIMKLQKHSIELYQQLAEQTGESVGHHQTGSVRLAHTQERLDEFKRVAGLAKIAGMVGVQVVDNARLRELHPYLDTTGLLGGLWDPYDGHIDPTSVTNAMAKLARGYGATIVRYNPVTAIQQLPDARWQVTTEQGVITADIIVNAAGFRANEVAAMIGHQFPMCSLEHQYLVTDTIPELEKRPGLLPLLRDPDISYYLRQEGKGLILGPYERNPVAWAVDGVPAQFGQELLQPELGRLENIIGEAIEQIGLIGQGGIKTVVNGPIVYTPDGLPLLGPVHGYDNYFACAGFSFGITQGGGAGRYLAQWIMHGHPEVDLWELDSRRFGSYANLSYTVSKALEVYANEYQLGQPNEYAMRPACREQKTSPVYSLLKVKGAVHGAFYGWERPSWFAVGGQPTQEAHSFSRGNWDAAVRAECEAVAQRAGVLDLTPFTKFEISGEGARAYLDRISPNRLPAKPGDVALAHVLTDEGSVAWEFSVTLLQDGRFYLMCPAAAELLIDDWLRVRAKGRKDVQIRNVTREMGALILAGPRSREVLAQLTDTDLSNEAFPWFTGQEIEVSGVPVRALRMNFVGELGWELHHPIDRQIELYLALMEAGKSVGIADFGMRAMDSMRLEKGYQIWGRELTTEYSALASGMGYFIKSEKGDFEGHAAVIAEKGAPSSHRLVLMEVEAGRADALGSEPIFQGDEMVGLTTSGAYGYRVEKSLALGFIRRDLVGPGTQLSIEILGERCPAIVTRNCVYDPTGARLKH